MLPGAPQSVEQRAGAAIRAGDFRYLPSGTRRCTSSAQSVHSQERNKCLGAEWHDCGMNRRKKEKQVEALGPPWSKTMDVYKQARDKQLEIVNASDETTAIKTAWRKYHQRHYEKLIRLIVKLAKQRKQSAKLTTGRPKR